MSGYADEISHLELGSVLNSTTGRLDISILWDGGEWAIDLPDFDTGMYWQPGLMLPYKRMNLYEFLQRVESTCGLRRRPGAT